MTPRISQLHPYPFERLAKIKSEFQSVSDKTLIDMSIGEPKHTTPGFIKKELINKIDSMAAYPTTRGHDLLRTTIKDWLINRFKLPSDSLGIDHVLPVNGTREALFAIAQCVVDTTEKSPLILSPNPFYQIYEGAAILAGAEPYYLNCTQETDYLPDFDSVSAETWEQCQLVYICSPGNPTGAVLPEQDLIKLLALSDQYNFVIASDECYSEIYFDEDNPPIGLLEAAARSNRHDYKNCLVFHSLSKRSNVPGLRSGFVAGDKDLIKNFLLYRTYHGCAMPLPTQYASIAAWQDEKHVFENREQYREKFDAVLDILSPVLNVEKPEASFYLWPEVPMNDVTFASELMKSQNVTVLPGSFLARDSNRLNPGENRVRIALVATLDQTIEAAERIKEFIISSTI
ncbi:MAG: succinyldiaminopimelate transaminase [Gammaproteobacteria bacterium]